MPPRSDTFKVVQALRDSSAASVDNGSTKSFSTSSLQLRIANSPRQLIQRKWAVTTRKGVAQLVAGQYTPANVEFKSEKDLLKKGDILFKKREDLLAAGDVSAIYTQSYEFERLLDIARNNGWYQAFKQLKEQGEILSISEEELAEDVLFEKALDLANKFLCEKLGTPESIAIQNELESLQTQAGQKGWNHIVRLVRNKCRFSTYKLRIFSNPIGHQQPSIESAKVDEAINSNIPNPQVTRDFLKGLSDKITNSGEENKEHELAKFADINASIAAFLLELEGNNHSENTINIIRAFNNTCKSAASKPIKLALTMLQGVLETGVKRRTERPLITVVGPEFELLFQQDDVCGMHMENLENQYDVLARKSSRPEAENVIIPGAIHEADIAFLASMRGIPDTRAALQIQNEDTKVSLTGSDGGGEKVYAIGHAAAINFGGALSNRGGERFYAILFPKGFLECYGLDLRTAGISGKSARTPTDEDFNRGSMYDDEKQTHKIEIPRSKAFATRAEDATPNGQVHIHFGRRNMRINDQPTSQLAFLRKHVLGVAEYNSTGIILDIKYFKALSTK